MAEKEPEKKDKPVSKKHSAADVLTKEEPDAKKKAEAKESEKKPAKKESKPAASKKGPKHTHIEHHANGSHTIRHTNEDGSENSYASPDTGSMISNLQQNLGQGGGAPEPDADDMPNAGAGAPPAAAPPQGAPAGGAY